MQSYAIVSWLSIQFLDRMAYDSSSAHEIHPSKHFLCMSIFIGCQSTKKGF